ncbi:MAG TPA: hypothetical protein VFA28_15990 [Bryobacteraceae bacterium]|nr:hypothetical protein [Bryobacteraceae bacterium]
MLDRIQSFVLSTAARQIYSTQGASSGAIQPNRLVSADIIKLRLMRDLKQPTRLFAKFVRSIMPGVIRPVHILWNQVIGFIFLVIACLVGLSTYRRAERFQGDSGGLLILIASCAFTGLLFWYGISSFLKARKISRS